MMPSPAPTATPVGACTQINAASLSDRPGIGRAPATNGATCVVPPGASLIEAGYRSQTTQGVETQTLVGYPNLIVRVGLRGSNEIVLLPGTAYTRRSGSEQPLGLDASSGSQDVGVGIKHLLFDGATFQNSANLFVTFPTGAGGASGFSAGLTTYSLGYSATWQATARLGVATTHNAILGAAPGSTGAATRFFQYQPSLSMSYALSPALTLLAEDQGAFPNGPGAGSGNRALVGIQLSLSPDVVLDADTEANLLPPNAVTQHAYDIGVTILVPR